jgi:hypothetical protein
VTTMLASGNEAAVGIDPVGGWAARRFWWPFDHARAGGLGPFQAHQPRPPDLRVSAARGHAGCRSGRMNLVLSSLKFRRNAICLLLQLCGVCNLSVGAKALEGGSPTSWWECHILWCWSLYMVVRIEWCWQAMRYGGSLVIIRLFAPRAEGGEIMPAGNLARLGHGGDVH